MPGYFPNLSKCSNQRLPQKINTACMWSLQAQWAWQYGVCRLGGQWRRQGLAGYFNRRNRCVGCRWYWPWEDFLGNKIDSDAWGHLKNNSQNGWQWREPCRLKKSLESPSNASHWVLETERSEYWLLPRWAPGREPLELQEAGWWRSVWCWQCAQDGGEQNCKHTFY